MEHNKHGSVSSGEAPTGGGDPDERSKLSVIKRLKAQGLTPEQISEHLDQLDQQQAEHTYEAGVKRRGVKLFSTLSVGSKILGPDGNPL